MRKIQIKYIVILILTLIIPVFSGCSLPDSDKEPSSSRKLYESIVPGVPVAPGKRAGGLYRVLNLEQSNFDRIKEKYVDILFVVGVCGLGGIILAAVMFYYQKKQWIDVAAISLITATVGVVGSLYFDQIVWVLVIAAITGVVYFVMILVRKHKDEKFKEAMVRSFQSAKGSDWKIDGISRVAELELPRWITNEVDEKKKRLFPKRSSK